MAKKKNVMTLERLEELWLSPYGKGMLPDYSQIYPHYHPDCLFHDSLQAFRGRDTFIQMCERLEKRCSEIYMDVHSMGQNGDNIFFLEWTMTMSIRNTPLTPIHGATRLNVDEDGLITLHRDYYDLWGDAFDAIPVMGKMYRWFTKNVMG